jgi:hypothetical protein
MPAVPGVRPHSVCARVDDGAGALERLEEQLTAARAASSAIAAAWTVRRLWRAITGGARTRR